MPIQWVFQVCMMANFSRVIKGGRLNRNPSQLTFNASTSAKSMNLACLFVMIALNRPFVSVECPNSFISGSSRQIRVHLSIPCRQFSARRPQDRRRERRLQLRGVPRLPAINTSAAVRPTNADAALADGGEHRVAVGVLEEVAALSRLLEQIDGGPIRIRSGW